MNIIVKHIIGGVIFLAVSVGAAFWAFKYGEYVGNERAMEELNRFKGILSKTEETKYLNGEWWFYVDLYGYHQRSDDNYDSYDACKEAFSNYTTGELEGAAGGCAKNCILNIGENYSLSLSKCEEYKPL